jgi:crotonobetainyl-CoA:carnitine CoA-transferase CaiB-like acyl-CoA transferase
MVSVSTMGQDGTWKDYVAYGPTLHALSGLTYLTSYNKDSPMGLGYAYADFISGLYAAFATLSALEYREKTGQSQYIDLSEYEAICTLLGPTFLDISQNHKQVLPYGNRSNYLSAAPYGCYKCLGTDRWCVIAVFNGEEWQSLCHILGHPDWTKDEKFSTLSKRQENAEELDGLLTHWTIQHPPEEVVDLLQEAGISAGVVQSAEDLARDPQLLARHFFIQLEHPTIGRTISDRSPIRFADDLTVGWKAGPVLGEDNRYVFIELLGLTEGEFSSLIEKGVIG